MSTTVLILIDSDYILSAIEDFASTPAGVAFEESS